MQQFISRASDEIQSLFSLHVGTSDDFHDVVQYLTFDLDLDPTYDDLWPGFHHVVVQYFGENPRDTTSAEWFSDIAVFVNKFEVSTQPPIFLGYVNLLLAH